MFASAIRERFTSMVELEDEDIDLLAAALLIAQEEFAELNIVDHVSTVDRLGERLSRLVSAESGFHNVVYAMNRLLYEDEGYRGNLADYEDPDNSMMNRVLERKKGIPITLSLLCMEVGRRAGVELEGVNFPGHFVIRLKGEEGTLCLDPFRKGRVLLQDDLEELLRLHLGPEAELEPHHLVAASRKDILGRVLYNLKSIYARKRDVRRALMAVERLVILRPQAAEERRDRGILYGLSGYRMAAIADLEDYLQMRPGAQDVDQVKRRLQQLHRRAVD